MCQKAQLRDVKKVAFLCQLEGGEWSKILRRETGISVCSMSNVSDPVVPSQPLSPLTGQNKNMIGFALSKLGHLKLTLPLIR